MTAAGLVWAGWRPWAEDKSALRSALTAEFGGADVTIGFEPADHGAGHGDRQRRCDGAGKWYLPVSVSAREVRVGPLVPPNGQGCAECLENWLDAEAGVVGAPSCPDKVWSEAVTRAAPIRWLVDEAIAALLREGPAAAVDQPARRVLRITAAPAECSQHVVIPHPRCTRCRENDAPRAPVIALEQAAEPAMPGFRARNEAIDRQRLMARWYDPYCGLVQRIGEVESSLVPMTAALFVDDRRRRTTQSGIGRDGTRAGSTRIAILEALERFAGARTGGGRPNTIAPPGRDPTMVNPTDFVLHDATQQHEPGFSLRPYCEQTPIAWIEARELATGATRLVPEQLVFYGQDPGASHQLNRFVFEISNGCALGSSLEEATLHGLFEVLERDAFLGIWYSRRTPAEIDLETVLDLDFRLLRIRVEGEGFEVRAFDASTSKHVACVVVAIIDHDPATPFASIFASGAHADPAKALMGALVEAASSFGGTQRTSTGAKREAALRMLADGSEVRVMADHMLLYSAPQALERLAFILADRPKSAFPDLFGNLAGAADMDVRSYLATLVAELRLGGLDTLVVDQTFAALQPSGLHCVKVLVPGMLSMTFGHQYRRISRRRLASAHGLTEGHDVNQHPHNFP